MVDEVARRRWFLLRVGHVVGGGEEAVTLAEPAKVRLYHLQAQDVCERHKKITQGWS